MPKLERMYSIEKNEIPKDWDKKDNSILIWSEDECSPDKEVLSQAIKRYMGHYHDRGYLGGPHKNDIIATIEDYDYTATLYTGGWIVRSWAGGAEIRLLVKITQ